MDRTTRSLALDSAMGNPIDNGQLFEISNFESNQFSGLEKRYEIASGKRCEPTPRYNCHGLTFGSRRTCIFDAQTVRQVLKEDGYEEIPSNQVMLGDVIIYFSSDFGDIEHSGMVVDVPKNSTLRVPLICSKWGKYAELIHWANQCPYDFSRVRYYRIRNLNP